MTERAADYGQLEIPDRRVAAVKADRLREALSAGDIEHARDVHAALGQFLDETETDEEVGA
jgi:hypothetical protein